MTASVPPPPDRSRRSLPTALAVAALAATMLSCAPPAQQAASPPSDSRNAGVGAEQSQPPSLPWLAGAADQYTQNRQRSHALRKLAGASQPDDPPTGRPRLHAAQDPYRDTTTIAQSPPCQADRVDPAQLPRDTGSYYVIDGPNAYRIPVDEASFCHISVTSSPKVATGPGQRVYFTVANPGTPAETVPYSFQNADQKYALGTASGTIYLRVVQSVDVIDQVGECASCDFRGSDLTGGYSLVDADLSGSDFSGATLFNIDFGSGVTFAGSVFGVYQGQPVTLADVSFDAADLSGATFDGVALDDTVSIDQAVIKERDLLIKNSVLDFSLFGLGQVSYTQCVFMVTPENAGLKREKTFKDTQIIASRFGGAPPDFTRTIWTNSDLSNSDFSNLAFYSANFADRVTANGTLFSGAKMAAAPNGPVVSFSTAQLREADFSRASLLNANFSSAKLGTDPAGDYGAATFDHSVAQGANFDGIDANAVNFNNAYLTRGDFQVNFNGAILTSASFNYALIGGGVFTGANLTGSQFYRAQCISCDVTTAIMANTNLTESYLYGTDLSQALKLDGSDLRDSLCCSTLPNPSSWAFVAAPGATLVSQSYTATNLSGAKFGQTGTCPSGHNVVDSRTSQSGQCAGQETPRPGESAPYPPICVAAGTYLCANTIALAAGNGQPGYSALRTDGTPLPPTSAKFSAPTRLLVNTYAPDPSKPLSLKTRLLISDTQNHVIRALSLPLAEAQMVSVFAGQPQKTGVNDGVPALDALLNMPAGLAVDPIGRIYIADAGNNRIRRISTDGVISTVAGDGTEGNSGDTGPAIRAHLNHPQGVAVSCSTGNAADCSIYIADTGNNRIRQIRSDGRIFNFAGRADGTPTSDDKSNKGDTGLAVRGTLRQPTAATIDGRGNIFVADAGNDLVRYVAASNSNIYSFNNGSPYHGVNDVQIDSASFLYMAQAGPQTNVIRRADAVTGRDMPGIIAGTGQPGYSGDNLNAMLATLRAPQGITPAAPWGPYYVADTANNRIRVVSPDN